MTHIKFRPQHTRELLRDSMIPGNLMNAFDSLFNDQVGKFERNVFFTPRTDVVENEKSFTVSVVLPGLKKEDIKVDVDGDRLTISGERKQTVENKEVKLHQIESFYGKFTRSFTLPENADKQSITAELTDGILHLSIPKVELKDTKTSISIK